MLTQRHLQWHARGDLIAERKYRSELPKISVLPARIMADSCALNVDMIAGSMPRRSSRSRTSRSTCLLLTTKHSFLCFVLGEMAILVGQLRMCPPCRLSMRCSCSLG